MSLGLRMIVPCEASGSSAGCVAPPADRPSHLRTPSLTRRLVAWVAASRAHRVILLISGVWILNAFDLVLTITAHRQHLLHELNPLAKHLLSHGEVFLALFKIGLLSIGTYALLKFRQERIAELGCFVVIATYVLVALQWHFCYEVYATTINCGPDVLHLWQPAQAPLPAWTSSGAAAAPLHP